MEKKVVIVFLFAIVGIAATLFWSLSRNPEYESTLILDLSWNKGLAMHEKFELAEEDFAEGKMQVVRQILGLDEQSLSKLKALSFEVSLGQDESVLLVRAVATDEHLFELLAAGINQALLETPLLKESQQEKRRNLLESINQTERTLAGLSPNDEVSRQRFDELVAHLESLSNELAALSKVPVIKAFEEPQQAGFSVGTLLMGVVFSIVVGLIVAGFRERRMQD